MAASRGFSKTSSAIRSETNNLCPAVSATRPRGPDKRGPACQASPAVTPPAGRSRWLLPGVMFVFGVVAGIGLAASFAALHSNWNQLPWVTPDAKSTAPFWFTYELLVIVISVGWTGLILH